MILLQIILVYRYINLRLEPLVKLIQDKCLLIDFLLQRKDSKPVVIQVNSLSYHVFVFLVLKSMRVTITPAVTLRLYIVLTVYLRLTINCSYFPELC